MDPSFIMLDECAETVGGCGVVETDVGYYWLTCSFDNDRDEIGEGSLSPKEWNYNKSHDGSVIMNDGLLNDKAEKSFIANKTNSSRNVDENTIKPDGYRLQEDDACLSRCFHVANDCGDIVAIKNAEKLQKDILHDVETRSTVRNKDFDFIGCTSKIKDCEFDNLPFNRSSGGEIAEGRCRISRKDNMQCNVDSRISRNNVENSRKTQKKCNSDIVMQGKCNSLLMNIPDMDEPTKMEMKSSLSLPNFFSFEKLKFWKHGSHSQRGRAESGENLRSRSVEKSPLKELSAKVYRAVSVELPQSQCPGGNNDENKPILTKNFNSVGATRNKEVGNMSMINGTKSDSAEKWSKKKGKSFAEKLSLKISGPTRKSLKKEMAAYSKRKSAEEILSSLEQSRKKDFKAKSIDKQKEGNRNGKEKCRSCDAVLLSTDVRLETLADIVDMKNESYRKNRGNEEVNGEVRCDNKEDCVVEACVDMNDTVLEPPVMFKDVDEGSVSMTTVPDGFILEPPPAFASDPTTDDEEGEMNCQRPLVWDPGVQSGETTMERKHKHPVTPPPPSLDRTERLISNIMNQRKHRKYSADGNSGLELPEGSSHRKSVDASFEVGDYCEVPCLPPTKCECTDMDVKEETCLGKKSEMEDSLNMTPKIKPRVKMGTKTVKKHTDLNGNIQNNRTKDEMLDLLDSYQTVDKGQYAEIDDIIDQKNTQSKLYASGSIILDSCYNDEVDTLNRSESLYATVNKHTTALAHTSSDNPVDKYLDVEDNEDDNIYAVVDKKNIRNRNDSRPKAPSPVVLSTVSASEEPPPIPPKPKNLGLNLNNARKQGHSDKVHLGKDGSNVHYTVENANTMAGTRNKTVSTRTDKQPAVANDNENCEDLQVMLNSLSPVLLRRRPSSNKLRKNAGSSTDTSPDGTPEVSPRVEKPKVNEPSTGRDAEVGTNSLFMDTEMARTWHGNTSTDWSNIYGPQLRAMMKELNDLTNNKEQTTCSETKLQEDKLAQDFEYHSQTMPTRSLLDEMHKKVCADQYWNNHDAETARALVLFRLKAQPPVKPKRSQSFHIRMGTGSSRVSGGSNMSPMLPRAAERIYIKTKPGLQFSKSHSLRSREITPATSETSLQAQNSRKEEAEIEAVEACRWLRETGFPQYAQLYEDGQFPVDVESVEKDHDFLDKEDIQSLFRRLNTLNKCAIMKIGTTSKKETEESDEEDQCALSDKWKYQRSSRRWSRKDLEIQPIETQNGKPVLRSSSSHDSLLGDQNSSSETGDSPVLDSRNRHQVRMTVDPLDANANTTVGVSPPAFRRTASDRIKGAKNFLKRMESLKSKRSRKQKTITEIGEPVISNKEDMQAKIKHLNCRDINESFKTERKSDLKITEEEPKDLGARSNCSIVDTVCNGAGLTDSEESSVFLPLNTADQRLPALVSGNGNSSKSDTSASLNGAFGLDLSVHSQESNKSSIDDSLFHQVEYRPGRFPKCLDESLFVQPIERNDHRHRSFSLANDSSMLDNKVNRRGSYDPRNAEHRVSIYDNVPIQEDLAEAQQELDIILSELFQNINGFNKAIYGEDAELLEPPASLLDDTTCSIDSQPNETTNDEHSDVTHEEGEETEVFSGTLSSPDSSDHELHMEDMSHDDSAENIGCRERRDSGVGSSLTRTNSDRRKYRIRWHSFQKSHRPNSDSRNLQLCSLSAGQILVLKKLSLLKLTALLEKYSPGRSGWSLSMPRNLFKRNKVPDYKNKNVFGVPFTVIIQRTGQALPQCILHAMRFLRRTAEDALGIFRKSGVRSRIQKLRNEIEANPESVNFEELQAYDVADLVKQYFRELPECLLTNKLSDIFISIFIYVPIEMRLEALQACVVLMADENRDVLQSLLLFLSDIAKQHQSHQMTASNLAVCFAPSLFNMGGTKNPSQTPSPRRNRKNPGIPDARELMEQKAAHECLTIMITECKKLFTMSAATLSKCRVWHGDPVSLEELNSTASEGNQGYTAYIEACIQGLLKESREKFRGWVSEKMPADCEIDVSNKKVGDGHPLRLWKCSVEVEAPPSEVLNRVLNDRQQWDEDLLQWNTMEKLDKQTEVFQYVRNSMAPHPTRDFCVLRSWRTDLPKGTCVLISTSIEHPRADLKGGLRAVELASRYLIEPCGTGKSRLTHISRVDIRGHSPDWYKKVYGYICAGFMERIRLSFQSVQTDGPETKV